MRNPHAENGMGLESFPGPPSGRGSGTKALLALAPVAVFLAAAETAAAGPMRVLDNPDLTRPIRGALGVWTLFALLLVHLGVCAAIIGWAHLVRAVSPGRMREVRALAERRPFACFLLGLLNAIVALVLLNHTFPLAAIALLLAVLFGIVVGLAGIIEGVGVRLLPVTAEDPSMRPGAALWRGGIALALATAVPFIGQALTLVLFCLGLGAAILSLFTSPQRAKENKTGPSAPASEPES